jgi:hypothetical protein
VYSPSSSESGQLLKEFQRRIISRYFNHFRLKTYYVSIQRRIISSYFNNFRLNTYNSCLSQVNRKFKNVLFSRKNIIPPGNPSFHLRLFFPPKGQNFGLTQTMLPLQDISKFEKYGKVSKILLVTRLNVWYSHSDLYFLFNGFVG